jgi:hypothetical protein
MNLFDAFYIAVALPSVLVAEPSPKTQNALHYASLAFYYQSGLEEEAKMLERRYVTQEMRDVGSVLMWLDGILIKKQIKYSWSF